MTTENTAPPGDATPAKRPPKTFAQTLQDHHYGYTADEATKALALCIAESEKSGKATELILKMKIKPASKAQGRYDVLVDIDTKLPPKPREAAIMFVGPDGNLTTKDPRQDDLPGLRVVDKPVATIKVDDDKSDGAAIRVG